MSASESNNEEKKGVKDVCKQFLLKSDELLANKLQLEECFEHYKNNRITNQVKKSNLEKSLPLIKSYELEYRDYIRKKSADRSNRSIEETDAAIAYEIQQEYIRELEREKLMQQIRDQELAKRLQEKEILVDIGGVGETSDANAHLEIDKDVLIIDDKIDEVIVDEKFYIERLKKEQEDFSYAKYLQEQEEKQILAQKPAVTKQQYHQNHHHHQNSPHKDTTNIDSVMSKIQKKLHLGNHHPNNTTNSQHQSKTTNKTTSKMSQSNANLNKLVIRASNEEAVSSSSSSAIIINKKLITSLSCKNLSQHHQVLKEIEIATNNDSVEEKSLNYTTSSKSATCSLNSTSSSSSSSSTSSLTSSSIDARQTSQSGGGKPRAKIAQENIYLETTFDDVLSNKELTLSLAISRNNNKESSNINRDSNNCFDVGLNCYYNNSSSQLLFENNNNNVEEINCNKVDKIRQRRVAETNRNNKVFNRQENKRKIAMDFDCNATDYISSFKNDQLVEEESLIDDTTNFDQKFKNKCSLQSNHRMLNTDDFCRTSNLVNKKEYISSNISNNSPAAKCDLISLSHKQDEKLDLSQLIHNPKHNIVAAIDPTFQQKKYASDITGFEHEKVAINKTREIDSFDADTDMFLPVKGERRETSINKNNNLKKKKSQSQCLQQ